MDAVSSTIVRSCTGYIFFTPFSSVNNIIALLSLRGFVILTLLMTLIQVFTINKTALLKIKHYISISSPLKTLIVWSIKVIFFKISY